MKKTLAFLFLSILFGCTFSACAQSVRSGLLDKNNLVVTNELDPVAGAALTLHAASTNLHLNADRRLKIDTAINAQAGTNIAEGLVSPVRQSVSAAAITLTNEASYRQAGDAASTNYTDATAAQLRSALSDHASPTNLQHLTNSQRLKIDAAINAQTGTNIAESLVAPVRTSINQHLADTNKHTSATEKTNWNTAYGWGNHALAGYLTDPAAFATAEQGMTADLAAQQALSAAQLADDANGAVNNHANDDLRHIVYEERERWNGVTNEVKIMRWYMSNGHWREYAGSVVTEYELAPSTNIGVLTYSADFTSWNNEARPALTNVLIHYSPTNAIIADLGNGFYVDVFDGTYEINMADMSSTWHTQNMSLPATFDPVSEFEFGQAFITPLMVTNTVHQYHLGTDPITPELHADSFTNLIWKTVWSNGWCWAIAYTNTP